MPLSGRWQSHTLEEVARIRGGGTPSRANGAFFGGDIPWVTPTDLPPIGRLTMLGSVKGSITAAGLANCSAKLIPEGSVLFSSRASIGKIAVANRVCTTNQGIVNFIPDRSRVDTWFLAYLLCYHTGDLVQACWPDNILRNSAGKAPALPGTDPATGPAATDRRSHPRMYGASGRDRETPREVDCRSCRSASVSAQ